MGCMQFNGGSYYGGDCKHEPSKTITKKFKPLLGGWLLVPTIAGRINSNTCICDKQLRTSTISRSFKNTDHRSWELITCWHYTLFKGNGTEMVSSLQTTEKLTMVKTKSKTTFSICTKTKQTMFQTCSSKVWDTFPPAVLLVLGSALSAVLGISGWSGESSSFSVSSAGAGLATLGWVSVTSGSIL